MYCCAKHVENELCLPELNTDCLTNMAPCTRHKGLINCCTRLVALFCVFFMHTNAWAATPTLIALANEAFIEKRDARGRDENGDMILIGDEFGTTHYASILPSIANELTARGWTTWLVQTPSQAANVDDATTEALTQVIATRQNKQKPLVVLAQGGADKFVLQWLLGKQIQGGILFNATAQLSTQLNTIPTTMNGKLMELCASNDEYGRKNACIQRIQKPIPQIRSYRLPASTRNYAHQDLWVVNLVDGFTQKLKTNN